MPYSHDDSLNNVDRGAQTRFERPMIATAVMLALVLGFANAGAPSYWHDELVHLYAAKNVLETGVPRVPSGNFYPSGLGYSYLLAGVVALFGDGEVATRAPSAVFHAISVLLLYLLVKRLLDTPTAIVAAYSLALSPWSVSWAREARFYSMQQALYLLTLLTAWRAIESESRGHKLGFAGLAAASYLAGLSASLHSVLFLGAPGAYAAILATRTHRRRHHLVAAFIASALVLATAIAYYLLLPQADHDAVFKEGGLGGRLSAPLSDPLRRIRWYYLDYFYRNLSRAYLLLTIGGLVAMLLREGRRGLYASLAFLIPFLALTFLIGYRRERFMFFAYPMYVAAHAYAMVALYRFVITSRQSRVRLVLAAVIFVFALRLGVSTYSLLSSTIRIAGGDSATLAQKHAQWREPCRYVREHRGDAVVLTTSYLPVLHYVGRADNWYPSRYIVWEVAETGLEGLRTVDELETYMRDHPRGYFIAEWARFGRWPMLADDLAWVERHMSKHVAASNADVTVYSWGL